MIRVRPVKCCAMNHQNALLFQQVEHHAFVVADIEFLLIHFREAVQCALWFGAADPWHFIQHFVGDIALLTDTAFRRHQIINTLITTQGCLNSVHSRYVGTQTHLRQHFQTFDVIAGQVFSAADNHPAGTETGQTIVFR